MKNIETKMTVSELQEAIKASLSKVRLHFTAKGNPAWRSFYRYGKNDREIGSDRLTKREADERLAEFGLTANLVVEIEKALEQAQADKTAAMKASGEFFTGGRNCHKLTADEVNAIYAKFATVDAPAEVNEKFTTVKAENAEHAVEILDELNFRHVTFEYHGDTNEHRKPVVYRHFDGVNENGNGTCFGLIEIVINGKLDTVRFINSYRETAVDIKLGDAKYTLGDKGEVILTEEPATVEEKADEVNAVEVDASEYAITEEAFNFAVEAEIAEAEIAAHEARIRERTLADEALAAQYEKAKTQAKCFRCENGYYGWYFKGKNSDEWERDDAKAKAVLTKCGLRTIEFIFFYEAEIEQATNTVEEKADEVTDETPATVETVEETEAASSTVVEVKTFDSGKYALKLNGKKVALKTFALENLFTVPLDTEIIFNGRKLSYIGQTCEVFDREYVFADESGNGARDKDFDSLLWNLAKFGTHDVSKLITKIANRNRGLYFRFKVEDESKPVDDNAEVFNLLPTVDELNDIDDEVTEPATVEVDTVETGALEVEDKIEMREAEEAVIDAKIKVLNAEFDETFKQSEAADKAYNRAWLTCEPASVQAPLKAKSDELHFEVDKICDELQPLRQRKNALVHELADLYGLRADLNGVKIINTGGVFQRVDVMPATAADLPAINAKLAELKCVTHTLADEISDTRRKLERKVEQHADDSELKKLAADIAARNRRHRNMTDELLKLKAAKSGAFNILLDKRDNLNKRLGKLDAIKRNGLIADDEHDTKAAELDSELRYVEIQIDALKTGDTFDYVAAKEHIENVYEDVKNCVDIWTREHGLTPAQCEQIYIAAHIDRNFDAELDRDLINRMIEEFKHGKIDNEPAPVPSLTINANEFDNAVKESKDDYCARLDINGETISFEDGLVTEVASLRYGAYFKITNGRKIFYYRGSRVSKQDFFAHIATEDKADDERKTIAEFVDKHGGSEIKPAIEMRGNFVAQIHVTLSNGRTDNYAATFDAKADAHAFIAD